jgi:anaerobic magnesium-protoporphyrin IX monomethyl ester cyclase
VQRDHVLFVGFSEQDNLGIGYIASVLLAAGMQPVIVDFRLGAETIRNEILAYQPRLVGFSIIFQYHIYEFRDLIVSLRESGIHCHFTAGGHYPSLRYQELLGLIPELDSVVLFEGEYTCLELVKAIASGQDWRHIQGIAYRDDGQIIATPLRPLEPDLDTFPPPVRPPLREYVLGKKHATILAGRGCLYNCSFCSIRQFYSTPPGPVKRLRRPEMVVREMELLHRQRDCAVFMFQDDDFPLAANTGKQWTMTFCDLLERTGLARNILWKVNCRPDEIDREIFARMQSCGLYLVYLGIECGTDEGLALMNKRLTATTSSCGVEILKHLGIQYDYGFMLFDPGSTYSSVLANIDFLERICGDGSSPITFCKMLPYAETQIEQRLLAEGRLKGRTGFRDYGFLDRSLDYFYTFLADSFNGWVGSRDGILNLARWTRYYLAVARKYYPDVPGLDAWESKVTDLIRQTNHYFFQAVRSISPAFAGGVYSDRYCEETAQEIGTACSRYKRDFNALIHEIEVAVTSSPAK